jgi:hypothetical protein
VNSTGGEEGTTAESVHCVVTTGLGAWWCEQVPPAIEAWVFRGSNSFLHPLNREHASLDETMLGLSVFPQAQRIPPVRAV